MQHIHLFKVKTPARNSKIVMLPQYYFNAQLIRQNLFIIYKLQNTFQFVHFIYSNRSYLKLYKLIRYIY